MKNHPETNVVRAVQNSLDDALLKPEYRDRSDRHPVAGHCYTAAEAVYHLMGGRASGLVPVNIRHEGDSHWYLKDIRNNRFIDPTHEQFKDPVPYEQGTPKGFLTTQPSKRAQIIMDRAQNYLQQYENEPNKFTTIPYDVPPSEEPMNKSGALDPQFTQKNPNMRYAYHSTWPHAIHSILDRGLIPHDNPEGYGASNYSGTWVEPRANRVYLGTEKKVNNYDAPMLRVDLDKVRSDDLGSDEDAHSGRADQISVPRPQSEFAFRHEHGETLGGWADKHADILDSPENVQYSYANHGTISHLGKIPPQAIDINPNWDVEELYEFYEGGLEDYGDDPYYRKQIAELQEKKDGIEEFLKEEYLRRTGIVPERGADIHQLMEWFKEQQSERRWMEKNEYHSYTSSFSIEAAWPDIMQKAKRYLDTGKVVLHRNGFNHVVGTIIGDHGTYQTELSRQDPDSRAITGWSCSCPWGDYAWGRSRKFRKYEGRPCAHVLSLLWKAYSTPLDEDMEEDQVPANGEKTPMIPEIQEQQQEQVEESPEYEELEPDSTLEPPSVKDLTLPGQPLPPGGPPQKDLVPKLDPNVNQPMKNPPVPPKNPYHLPGALSRRYAHVARFVAGEDIPVFVKVTAVDVAKLKHLIEEGQTPIAKAVTPIYGEYSGGKIPVPNASPQRMHDDGTPLYGIHDLGWDPKTNTQMWPPQTGPEETGRFGEIPVGASLEVWDVDVTTGWILVAYSTNFGPLQHHLIRAWVEPQEIALTGRSTPFTRRKTHDA
jgi:hypothetical protein